MSSSPEFRVQVRLSRVLAERVGQPFIVVTLPERTASVAQFRMQVARQYPVLQPWMASVLVVADGRVLGSSEALSAEQQLALLSPQAGG
ncbi:MoaD/ThiS family protein [Rhodothermus marinus]|jgi:molybdopterin converting factor small subunit|uniref:MoaD/ThiS family protein n=1 Tax=Rhodothermus marinus TaxID=29549 RepID=UPI001D31DE0F|nr:hypothetical protein [Rhodothermus marinus]MBO2491238.1 hypothetical protein [Rhodothermus marinus]